MKKAIETKTSFSPPLQAYAFLLCLSKEKDSIRSVTLVPPLTWNVIRGLPFSNGNIIVFPGTGSPSRERMEGQSNWTTSSA